MGTLAPAGPPSPTQLPMQERVARLRSGPELLRAMGERTCHPLPELFHLGAIFQSPHGGVAAAVWLPGCTCWGEVGGKEGLALGFELQPASKCNSRIKFALDPIYVRHRGCPRVRSCRCTVAHGPAAGSQAPKSWRAHVGRDITLPSGSPDTSLSLAFPRPAPQGTGTRRAPARRGLTSRHAGHSPSLPSAARWETDEGR